MSKRSVLIVEDEPLIAMMLEDFLESLGHDVVATCETVEDAIAQVDAGGFDIAIIDVNLDGEPNYPVADVLAERNVPFIFATGYGSKGLDTRYSNIPLLTKPFLDSELETALMQISKEV